MNINLEKALTDYADDTDISPEEAAERILSSFLIAAGFLKRPVVKDDDETMHSGKL